MTNHYVPSRSPSLPQIQHMLCRSNLGPSDMTLICGPHGSTLFYAHKSVLSDVSPWFANLFSSPKHNIHTHQLALSGFDPGAIQAFLQFCYTGQYSDPEDPYYCPDTAKATFEFHARIFVVACNHVVPALADVALGKMMALLEGCETRIGEEHADVWEWAIECVYIHSDVLGLNIEVDVTEPTPTLRERLDQLAAQQARSTHDRGLVADQAGRYLNASDRLKAVIVKAVVIAYRTGQNYRLLRRFARVSRDIPEFGADVASAILDPGPWSDGKAR